MHLFLFIKRFCSTALSLIAISIAAYPQYSNPVMPKSAPDPCVLQAPDGYFYVYPTCNEMRMPVYRSKNLTSWEKAGTAFAANATQRDLHDGNLWAPDVIYNRKQYVMAYALSKNGEYHDNGIGIAVSKSPTGPFDNKGLLFTSYSSGVRNSIDPSLVTDGRNLYLLWGSFNGLYIVRLDYSSRKGYYIKDLAGKVQLAGTAFEGAHIFHHNGYYYLFASVGTCCQGMQSTYHIGVGRSKSLFGPYLDKNGNRMLDNAYTLVVQGDRKFAGPGHGSEIITDDRGRTWYIYHSYVAGSTNGRQLMLDEIKWDADGWPYIQSFVPSSNSSESPYFKK